MKCFQIHFSRSEKNYHHWKRRQLNSLLISNNNKLKISLYGTITHIQIQF